MVVCFLLAAGDLSPLGAQTRTEASGDQGADLAGVDSSWATAEALENVVVQAVGRCERSVVAISRVRSDQAARSQLESLRLLPTLQLPDDPTSEDFVPSFFGSGVVLSADGHIVTCAHVLDDPRRHSYYVWLDRRCYTAEVVGLAAQPLASDPFSDLAVLKIEASQLSPIQLSASPPRKGQFVVALGNPYALARDGQVSASWGIVANLNRVAPRESDSPLNESIHQLGTLIQTDLRLAVGSSGGALVNLRGELVGLTTALVAQRGYEQSAGLAIAADEFFERVVASLRQGKQPEYGFLGIQPENLREPERARGLRGARVSMVIPGLPGSQAGLREGDVIVQVGEQPIGNRNDLFRELSKVPTGTKAQLLVHRSRPGSNAQVLNLEAELAKKYLASNRPAFSLHGPPTWRGAQVEYQTAIAGELERIAVVRGGPRVAFLNVLPDSPVWRAGLRAGFSIVSLDGQPIQTPEQFHQLADQQTGPTTLVFVGGDGRQSTAVVQPES